MSAQANLFSLEAHARAETSSGKYKRMILDYITFRGVDGSTADELEVALALPHQTCSARCSELKKAGLVRERGFRLTRTGSKAGVLVACGDGGKQTFWAEEK